VFEYLVQLDRSATGEPMSTDDCDFAVAVATTVLALMAKYEHLLERGAPANPGLPFDELYDLVTAEPAPAWQAAYEQVRSEVRELGLTSL
jgi:hypothetical protein